MFSLSNLISPLTGLSMVRAGLQKELKFKVPVYDIIYNAEKRSIVFVIPVDNKLRSYPYDESEKLCSLIDSMVKSKLKTGDVIDLVKVRHEHDRAAVDIYYKRNGEKLHLNNKL